MLLQTGKGADMGAVFGGGSPTLFGSGGAGNFLTRLTTGDGDRLHADVADPHLRPDAVDALAPAPAPPAPVERAGHPRGAACAGSSRSADAGAPDEAPLAAAPETGGQTEPAAPPAGQTPPAAGEAPAAKPDQAPAPAGGEKK